MKAKALNVIADYAVMIFACFLFMLAWEGFMIPQGMSSGGIMGLCTVIQFATGGFIKASISYIVVNCLLLLVAIAIFGVAFGFRTLFCITVSSLVMELGSRLEWLHSVPGNFFFVSQPVLVPIIAGALEAVAVGLIIRKGGSTGGTDIIALIVNKYYPVSLSKVFLISDFIIICTILLLPDKSFADTLYGFEMALTFSVVVDRVVVGNRSTIQVLIFSSQYEKIADYIINTLDRGVTLLRAQGWFTKEDKNVLLVLMRKHQLPSFTKAVKSIDPRAFMSVSQTTGVYGEGFEEIKAGIDTGKKKK